MNYYLDTSVLAPYYIPEPLSGRVERLIRRARQPAISPLVEIEFASVLARKLRAREISAGDARKVLERFHAHQAQGLYRILGLESAHLVRARRWIEGFRTPLRTLDALHLALVAGSQSVLLTADVQFAQAARKLKVRRRLLRA